MADQVRVLRVIEYTGPRDAVEKQLARSMKDGTYDRESGYNSGVVIRVATIGTYPEILSEAPRALITSEPIHPSEEPEGPNPTLNM